MTTNINNITLEVGDIVNTKTLKNILILSFTEVLFERNGIVNIENINMLKQHKIIEVINPNERK